MTRGRQMRGGHLRAHNALSACLMIVLVLASSTLFAQTVEPATPTATRTDIVHARRGETLTALLVRTGASQADAQDAMAAILRHWNPRALKADQEITIDFGQGRLQAVQLEAALDRI